MKVQTLSTFFHQTNKFAFLTSNFHIQIIQEKRTLQRNTKMAQEFQKIILIEK